MPKPLYLTKTRHNLKRRTQHLKTITETSLSQHLRFKIKSQQISLLSRPHRTIQGHAINCITILSHRPLLYNWAKKRRHLSCHLVPINKPPKNWKLKKINRKTRVAEKWPMSTYDVWKLNVVVLGFFLNIEVAVDIL